MTAMTNIKGEYLKLCEELVYVLDEMCEDLTEFEWYMDVNIDALPRVLLADIHLCLKYDQLPERYSFILKYSQETLFYTITRLGKFKKSMNDYKKHLKSIKCRNL